MGSEITIFSGYSQKENRTTNYSLLVLKKLYEENPGFLGEALSNLVDEELGNAVGVTFRQQTKKKGSVPDGLIVQRAFSLFIETKNYDWFYDDQLERHLDALDQEAPQTVKALIALGNFESIATERFAKIEALCSAKYAGRIYFVAASFEDFVGVIRENLIDRRLVSKAMADMVDDFEGYLDGEGLLPRWKYRLDVVNCSGRPTEITSDRIYICPAKGGAYNHARAQYFGMYREKAVQMIAQIEAVVEVEADLTSSIRWSNVRKPDAELLDRAQKAKLKLRPGDVASRVFLLGELHETKFTKPTKGGMQTSKRYFDIEAVAPKDAADLAIKLRGKTWNDFGA